MKHYFEEKGMVKSYHYLNRYLKFIDQYRDHKKIKYKTHGHHILPKADNYFPEYEKERWNIVDLPHRAHYLAHWMLAKAIGGTMWHPIKLFSGNFSINSSFYSEYSEQLAKESSRIHKGKKRSREEIEKWRKSYLSLQDNGKTLAENTAIKSAKTMSKIDDNGESIREKTNKKSVDTKSKTYNESGENIHVQSARKAAETRRTTINEEGLNINEVSGKKISKTRLLRGVGKGSKNWSAKVINIHDSNGDIVVKCYGDFVKQCELLDISPTQLNASYKKGEPLYLNLTKKGERMLKSSGRIKFKGWFLTKE